MLDHESCLDFLENQIPSLCAAAVKIAYWSTLAAGGSVLEVDGETIYEVFPDGTRRFVKQIEAPVSIKASRISLR